MDTGDLSVVYRPVSLVRCVGYLQLSPELFALYHLIMGLLRQEEGQGFVQVSPDEALTESIADTEPPFPTAT